MNDHALSLTAASIQPEVKLTILPLPTFSALAHEFLTNLPDWLGGLSAKGGAEPATGSRPGWGGETS